MNKMILVLTMFILLAPMVTLAAPDYNASYAPKITGFTVTITANVSGLPETSMNFTGKIKTNVYPNGTEKGKYRWGYIYNTGNSLLSFQMASPTPPSIILKVDAKSNMKKSFTVDSSPGHPSGSDWNGWRNVPPRRSADIFAVATFNLKATKNFNIPVNVVAR